MDSKISSLIDSYRDEYVRILRRWLQVPSVKGEPEDGAPFGKEVRRMLDMAMVDAETMGFMTHAFDGYAGDIVLGDCAEDLAVLAHLDVVPAGDGWKTDPFGAVLEGGRIYGRGTSDDKGPALAALFAMKALKEAGVPLKRGIRLILGCDEESGWEDMDWYKEHTDMPEVGFSPDASFPVINTEKALLVMELNATLSNEGLQVKKLWTGERHNVIPGECRALLAAGQAEADKGAAWAKANGLDFTFTVTEEGLEVVATGVPGHAAYPEGARNAIGMMLLLLDQLGVQGPLRTLAHTVGMEYNGASLGIACKDEVSGPLTCNIGILHLKDDGTLYATLDCRCPISIDTPMLRDTAVKTLAGIQVTTETMKAPHHVPADSDLVSSLLAAYHEETGLPAEAQSTGGGTYAKVLKQGVAFGAGFPDDEDLAHQANEYIEIDKMLLSAKIFANAMIRLAGK